MVELLSWFMGGGVSGVINIVELLITVGSKK
jgi:hypothetical protein